MRQGRRCEVVHTIRGKMGHLFQRRWAMVLIVLGVLASMNVAILPNVVGADLPSPTWTQQFPSTSPPVPTGGLMAYDSATRQIVPLTGMSVATRKSALMAMKSPH